MIPGWIDIHNQMHRANRFTCQIPILSRTQFVKLFLDYREGKATIFDDGEVVAVLSAWDDSFIRLVDSEDGIVVRAILTRALNLCAATICQHCASNMPLQQLVGPGFYRLYHLETHNPDWSAPFDESRPCCAQSLYEKFGLVLQPIVGTGVNDTAYPEAYTDPLKVTL